MFPSHLQPLILTANGSTPTAADVVASAFADAPAAPVSPVTAAPLAAPVPMVAAPAAATTLVPAAVGTTPPGASSSLGGTVLAGAFLLALTAVAAFLVARKRRIAPTQQVQIVESVSLGPKRSLVLARMGNEMLLLGSSEGGISVLSVRSAPAATTVAETAHTPRDLTSHALVAPATSALFDAPTTHAQDATAAVAFEAALRQAGEDQELRAKLAPMLEGNR